MTTTRFAVVVPVRIREPGHARDLANCLAALAACDPPPDEVVVVDDGSEPPVRLGAGGARLLRTAPRGPASARNTGARATSANILVFVDADVMVPPDTFARLAATFAADPDATAVWGTVSARVPDPSANHATRYKNHVHRHYTRSLAPSGRPTPTGNLTTMVAAVRRAAFEGVGGFREALTTVSVEDVELGRDLTAAGARVVFDPGLEVAHAHRWDEWSTLRNDAHKIRGLARAVVARRVAGGPRPVGLAGRRAATYAVGTTFVGLLGASLVLGRAVPAAGLFVAFLVSEQDLLRYLWREEGAAFAARSAGSMLVERLTVIGAAAVGAVEGAWAGRE